MADELQGVKVLSNVVGRVGFEKLISRGDHYWVLYGEQNRF